MLGTPLAPAQVQVQARVWAQAQELEAEATGRCPTGLVEAPALAEDLATAMGMATATEPGRLAAVSHLMAQVSVAHPSTAAPMVAMEVATAPAIMEVLAASGQLSRRH